MSLHFLNKKQEDDFISLQKHVEDLYGNKNQLKINFYAYLTGGFVFFCFFSCMIFYGYHLIIDQYIFL